jgi:hypothetical protein
MTKISLNDYTQKEENILKEINEIDNRLYPMSRMEIGYNRN